MALDDETPGARPGGSGSARSEEGSSARARAPADLHDTAPPEPSEYFFAGLLATGIAAVVIAIFTSFTGLQGTVVGAALGAMTGSLVTQIAKRPLSRAEARTIRTLGLWRRRSTRDPMGTLRALPGELASLWRRAPRRTLAAFVGIGACGLALGLTLVSLAEVATGRPLSALTTGAPTSGTTLGNLAVQAQRASNRPTAVPSAGTAEFATPSVAAVATASARVPTAGTTEPGAAPVVSPPPAPSVSPPPAPAVSPVPGGAPAPSGEGPAASPAPQPATPVQTPSPVLAPGGAPRGVPG